MFANYLKVALAVWQRRKFFTFISLFGIAFTLAVVLVAVAVLDHIFGEVPPEVYQDRTLGIYRVTLTSEKGGVNSGFASQKLLESSLHDLPGAEKVSISSIFWKAVSYVGERRIDSYVKYADAEFWEILRFRFLEGRPFTRDEVSGGAYVAVINEATRERFFGGESAVGRSLEADGTRYRVVGVVENVPMLRFVPFADIWVPLTTAKVAGDFNDLVGLHIGVILAKNRAAMPGIREEFLSRMRGVDLAPYRGFVRLTAVPESKFESVARLAFSQGRSEDVSSSSLLTWLVVFAVLFMVLPTINLVNINVSRIMERASEIGVRKAFGASSPTLVGQFVVENVLLTVVGGVFALVLGVVILGLIESAGWIPYASLHLNLRILAWGVGFTLFFGLLSGVFPAWRMARMNPVDALRGGVS